MESSHAHNDHLPEENGCAGSGGAGGNGGGAAAAAAVSDAVRERRQVLKRLKTASALCVAFFLVEVIGGILAGSLAILSDAAHLFSDFASFAVAIFANYLASMPSTELHTYGLKRTESLAALFSMVSLALVCVWLGVEALRRMYDMLLLDPDVVRETYEVDGKLMSGIATIGVLVNVALAFVLGEHHVHLPGSGGHDHSHDHGHEGHGDHAEEDRGHSHSHSHGHSDESAAAPTESTSLLKIAEDGRVTPEHTNEVPPPCSGGKQKKKRNVNLHAAYLHVLGDLAQSCAVLIAGLVIWFKPNWMIIDPICTLGFCILVFHSTLGVLRASVAVLLEEVPPKISYVDVLDDLSKLEHVDKIHHLHIWSISDGQPCLSLHASAADDDCGNALKYITAVCKKHGITHITAQVQPNSFGVDCITCEGSPHDDCF